ncbi:MULTISPECIES: hypothetical protein [Burkholderia cepacia complex]|uniref:hypothetical protein n=1 Tax=Burkholderia cepacia complex TaxID=87882 RepID=UPI0006694D60|nr:MULTISPECIES: hypothetical protein [Burkholderia cepacia complex]RQS84343.1 DUF2622 domain-containing protein [Burkholderia seminalis]
MARFTTRVILHGVSDSADTYGKLHEAMETSGFSRKILGADEIWYELPPAEYNLDAEMTSDQVLNKARAAANSVWTNNGVIVTEGARTWVGLKEAK